MVRAENGMFRDVVPMSADLSVQSRLYLFNACSVQHYLLKGYRRMVIAKERIQSCGCLTYPTSVLVQFGQFLAIYVPLLPTLVILCVWARS